MAAEPCKSKVFGLFYCSIVKSIKHDVNTNIHEKRDVKRDVKLYVNQHGA